MNRERWTGVAVSTCSEDDLAQAYAAGYEPEGPYFVGRDPRRMSVDEIEALGHQRLSPMAVVRAKCLDCCAGSSDEVRKCVALACPSWPYRTGHNPWRAPPSEAKIEAARRSAARMHASRADHGRGPSPDEETGGAGGLCPTITIGCEG
jgi:hypothetical protein